MAPAGFSDNPKAVSSEDQTSSGLSLAFSCYDDWTKSMLDPVHEKGSYALWLRNYCLSLRYTILFGSFIYKGTTKEPVGHNTEPL
ncbi:unnamed protein product [Sphenostylis stenocarpa]|uniref:Uncharacterized protein n=1 Tax=Sphenostylis stenocarpa TaxID=92480 RepID=A0AA86W0X1_9FABA|nr:unnamed protein product [Sphenostylis stenocarpa]